MLLVTENGKILLFFSHSQCIYGLHASHMGYTVNLNLISINTESIRKLSTFQFLVGKNLVPEYFTQ